MEYSFRINQTTSVFNETIQNTHTIEDIHFEGKSI